MLAAGCAGAAPGGRVEVSVVRSPNNTIHYSALIRASACRDTRGAYLSGVSDGNGILVLVRPGLVAGTYPLLAAGDTATARGAIVAARYQQADAVFGVALDSGTVEVTGRGPPFAVRVTGGGREMGSVLRVRVTVAFTGVPAPADSVFCHGATP